MLRLDPQIGAGVAGLQAARHLIGAGIKVVVLEAASEVGGVWRQNYTGYGLQGEQARRARAFQLEAPSMHAARGRGC
jgi:cation diffusion facilitator CzcD-associated flavoprotein CzcO